MSEDMKERPVDLESNTNFMSDLLLSSSRRGQSRRRNNGAEGCVRLTLQIILIAAFLFNSIWLNK